MTNEEHGEILRHIDWERQNIVYPGVTRHVERGVVRDLADDGESATIIYSRCAEDQLDEIIENERRLAQIGYYALEWKLYGHDLPGSLAERLAAGGFVAEDKEAFLVLCIDKASLDRFGEIGADIRRITDANVLEDTRLIYDETLGPRYESVLAHHREILENQPESLSVYVAYVDGEPASCGRAYFHEQSRFAGLYGGTTREKFRKRGLFTQIVAARLREAFSRGVPYAFVDALPTSEPILRKRGFELVTFTQPFTFSPAD
ncbi:MAG TPA: GNAT family N-acetyltransferase [Capsulimonadaceae bacterium]|nr:GNAT family N-acetyltransferase [Capsulimonadaceae bacterium]